MNVPKRETIFLLTPADLALTSLEWAIAILGERPVETTLICGEDLLQAADESCAIYKDEMGSCPCIRVVPDALLKNKMSWALRGYYKQVVSLMPD